jgi:AcrR family transcriptional regulator
MDEIARGAGLSSGTLYRNFASRQELLRALYDVLASELEALVEQIVLAPTGWDAITGYVDGVLAIAQAHPEMPPVMAYMRDVDSGYRARGRRWVAAAEQTAARAQEEGSLRADITAGDLVYLPHLLVPIVRWPEPQRGVLMARMRALLLDSLRPQAQHAPLPQDPLSAAAFRAAAFSPGVPAESASRG